LLHPFYSLPVQREEGADELWFQHIKLRNDHDGQRCRQPQ
jgi:hypothetical protein